MSEKMETTQHMHGLDAYRTRALIDGLVAAPSAAHAILDLIARADDPSADALERYAGSVLRGSDAPALCNSAVGPTLSLHMLPSGEHLRVIGAISPCTHRAFLSLEDALNRLLGISGALAEGVGAWGSGPATESSSRHRAYEQMGVEYPLWSDGRRNAHVVLPPIRAVEAPSEAYFNEVDWRSLDNVASNAHLVFQSSLLANLHRTVLGAQSAKGGEWDTRTRLAAIFEDLEPPLQFTYRFDCDMTAGEVVAHFNMPPIESLPTWWVDADGSPVSLGEQGEPARMAYALRLAALVGAACFGGGRHIENVQVVGLGDGRRPAFACAFERSRFVQETLRVIDSGKLASPGLRFDPDAIAQIISPSRETPVGTLTERPRPQGACAQAHQPKLQHAGFTGGRSVSVPTGIVWQDAVPRPHPQRVDPAQDSRILPPELQRLFHARHVRDIDTSNYLGGSADAIDKARADSDDSLVAAIAHLEGVVAEMEQDLTPPEDDPQARPLYCKHPASRIAIALLDDDLSVSEQAEAFLHPGGAHESAERPAVTYFRMPDALFHAHVGLSDLYQRLGDLRGAEAEADRCIALAPTTPIGYARKADALAERERFEEAANVLMDGLRYALTEQDSAYLYHNLAFMFWHLRQRHVASAIYIYTATLGGIYGEKALAFVKQVSGGAEARAFARASRTDALHEMARAGIPLAPNRLTDQLIAHAAIALADAHLPAAAAPYASLLAKRLAGDRTVVSACHSIQFGVE